MSRQSEAKEEQGFNKVAPMCSNCKKFMFQIVTKESYGVNYKHETNFECTQGRFKVGKTNWCEQHERIINTI